jgi:hypothetical protein
MPYKEKLKNPSANPRAKAKYKVTNWTDYNKSLRKRGAISLYFPKGEPELLFVNRKPYLSGISGQQATYKEPYIELMFTLYRLFGWGLRQITGYFEDLWKTKKLAIPVPSFGHLSDLFAALPVKIHQFCDVLKARIARGESIDLILDSTGLRFGKASHWYETKYGKPCINTPWRRMHLSMDPEMNMHGLEITDLEKSDIGMMSQLVPTNEGQKIGKVLADGAYYSIEGTQALYDRGIIPVIPPPIHAVVHGIESTQWHDYIVQYIKDKGTVYAFHKKYGYGKRSLVEAQISRVKRCVGTSLLTQRDQSQKNEGTIVANIINQWNSFGKCVSAKIV